MSPSRARPSATTPTSRSLTALRVVLERGFFHAGTWSSFRGRTHGRPLDPAGTPAWRLVVFDQDHDQVGNRATGDRLAASVDEGGLAIAAALTLLSPFTPMLFMGEEWAASTPWQFFTSHPEPELGRATAEGRIAEFVRMGWDPAVVPDPQDPETFRRSKLRWAEPYPEPPKQQEAGDAGMLGGPRAPGTLHTRMLQWYRRLIALRKSRPELRGPSMPSTHVEVDESARTVLVHRGTLVIAANLGSEIAAVPLGGLMLLSSTADDQGTGAQGTGAQVTGARVTSLDLPPRSVAVLDTTDTPPE